jgi:hypothetical protein
MVSPSGLIRMNRWGYFKPSQFHPLGEKFRNPRKKESYQTMNSHDFVIQGKNVAFPQPDSQGGAALIGCGAARRPGATPFSRQAGRNKRAAVLGDSA